MKFFDKNRIEQSSIIKKEKKHTVLLVDDELGNLRFLQGLLEVDYNILLANDGQEALELINKHPNPEKINLIITDQRMPRMTGIELLKEIINITPNSLRIILTGFSDIDAIIDAINEGKVYKFLTKPIEPKDLEITVKRALEAYELSQKNNLLVNELKELNSSLEVKVEERTSQLLGLNNVLTSLNESLKGMTEMIVHDLKNPLSNVLIFSDHIINKDLELQRNKDLAKLIKKSGNKMFKMIDSLLDISSIEQGRIDLKLEKVNSVQIVEQIITDFKEISKKKEISINFQYDSEELEILVDTFRLNQIMENIISNAIKFSELGKSITVGLYKQEKDIVFMIKDQGPGLTEEDKNKLFQKFANLSATPTGGEHSSRVGLSIAKSLVEAMSGKIWCESEIGNGSSFFFSIPASND